MTAPQTTGRSDTLVISLVAFAHLLSHFYQVVLGPLFPLLKEEFSVSYTELGLTISVLYGVSGVCQAFVGILVDRYGGDRLMLLGVVVMSTAVLLMGFAPAFWVLLPLVALAALGNSVFHPADYSILSGSISESRLGRAFSIHTFAGFLGGACAPLTMLAIAKFSDWRTAFIATGLVGLALWVLMLLRSGGFVGESASTPKQATGIATNKSGLGLLLTAPVLLFLLFFITYGMASGGLVAFTAGGLITLHGISVDAANTALTGHLFGIVGGILLAGLIVDRFPQHGITAGAAMVLAAIFVVLPLRVGSDPVLLIAIMAFVGIGLGLVLPPRDLMVRAMTPPGQTGKVFGFVFVGFAVGSGITPLFFGWLLDNGQPELVFTAVAAFIFLALCAITAAQKLSLKL